MAAQDGIPDCVHLIGIAGEGMAALAEFLLDRGHRITGSDLRDNAETERLRQRGAIVSRGHRAAAVHGAGMVIVSDAIAHMNAELEEARTLDLPILRRAEVLALVARDRLSIFVAGSHGKSSTVAMIATILELAGREPSFVAGARLRGFEGRRARFSPHGPLVAEACEAFGNLAPLVPDIAVILNIDDDHLEHYGSQERLDRAFADFLKRLRSGGKAYVNGDDEGVRRIAGRPGEAVTTIGSGESNSIRLRIVESGSSGTRFEVSRDGVAPITIMLPTPGRHMAVNAAASVAVCLDLGVAPAIIAKALGA